MEETENNNVELKIVFKNLMLSKKESEMINGGESIGGTGTGTGTPVAPGGPVILPPGQPLNCWCSTHCISEPSCTNGWC